MRWKSYISAVAAILLLRFLDLYITYRYTPDLKSEFNPLVALFGLTWTGFIVAQIIIVALISGIMLFYFNRKPSPPVQPGLPFHDFVYVYFFGKLRPWKQRIFTMPNNFRPHLVFNGFIFMLITILISVFAIVNNVLLIAGADFYTSFMIRHYKAFIPGSFVFITLFSVYFFFLMEYFAYKRLHKEKQGED